MSRHTTFKVGGPAQFFAVPSGKKDLVQLLEWSRRCSVEPFILGGGANIVVSDRGIRGLVIDMQKFTALNQNETEITAGAGWNISKLIEKTVMLGLEGLEFLYAMPGTLGGALWMNARCYGGSIADRLISTDYMRIDATEGSEAMDPESWGYKCSPFQRRTDIILGAVLHLDKGNPSHSQKLMEYYQKDRTDKGHFTAPSAGSVFKNNRAFGEPTGVIIDKLGLRGTKIGGAQLSPGHGNIIINTGNATANDIRELVTFLQSRVQQERNLQLEPEIRFIGKWEDE